MIWLIPGVLIVSTFIIIWWKFRYRRVLAPKEVKLAQTFHKLLDGGGDEAIGDLRELYVRSDHDVGIGLALGIVLRQRGDLRAAIRLHQSLINRSGLEHAVVAYLYAELAADFLASGLLMRAAEAMGQARETGFLDDWICHKGVSVYTKMRCWDDAIALLKIYAKQSRRSMEEEIAWVHVESAEVAIEDEDLDQAQVAFEKALSVNPACIPALLGVSSCYRLKQKPEKAQKYLSKHRAAFKEYLWLWIEESAHVANQIGHAEHFIKETIQALEQDPDDWRSRRVCAEFAMTLGMYEEASRLMAVCLELAPRVLIVHQSFWRLISRSPLAADVMKIYMGMVSDKMSFGRPYHCSACEYHTDAIIWRCPSCDRLRTITEKRI